MLVHNQRIDLPLLKEKQLELFIKREDLSQPDISGNKLRKLKYNLTEAKNQGHTVLLTFGGAYSNHIAATAFAGKKFSFKTIGIIRGEELHENHLQNPTLALAKKHGMHLKFISRSDYKRKSDSDFLKGLKKEFGNFYLLPEGGTNALAIKGCEGILNAMDADFDTICCPVGTGGTVAGIINASGLEQNVIGFSALKGNFLTEDICKFTIRKNWQVISDDYFGGYGKVTSELVEFINDFKRETTVLLDPIYTGKMLFGIVRMIKEDRFNPNTKILAIHTGGQQGIAGINQVLKKKNKPLIAI